MFPPPPGWSQPAAASFPTAATHPHMGWQTVVGAPHVFYAVVPFRGPVVDLYCYSTRTGETYQKRCQRGPAAVRQAVVRFVQLHG